MILKTLKIRSNLCESIMTCDESTSHQKFIPGVPVNVDCLVTAVVFNVCKYPGLCIDFACMLVYWRVAMAYECMQMVVSIWWAIWAHIETGKGGSINMPGYMGPYRDREGGWYQYAGLYGPI